MNAVSWTLIHSLWLGLVVALLAGLTVLLTKKSASATRYNILAVLSVLFLVAIGFIFSNELKIQQEKALAATAATESVCKSAVAVSGNQNNAAIFNTVVSGEAVCTPETPVITAAAPTPPSETAISAVSKFINDYASWIVWIWFAIFSIKCLSMASGLRHIYVVRNYQTVLPSEMWQKRLIELKTLLRIKHGVQLLESRLVTVPSVTGFFKPMILVPIGLLNNLPQEQVEAILLHELAHIRRSDYVVNLIQSFLEIVFFFNPGILWISSLLKEERENCCDDLAISVTQDKKEFVHALVSFQEYNLNGQGLALQFGNKKMHLADRAGRILFNRNKMLSTAEKYFLSVCIVMGTMLCFAFANMNPAAAQHPKAVFTTSLPPDTMISDTLYANRKYNPKAIPEGTSMKFADVINGKEYMTYIFKHKGVLYQVPEDMKNFMVNGKLITGDDMEKYLPEIHRLIEAYEIAIANDYTEDSDLQEEEYDFTEEERIIEEASRRIDEQSEIITKQSKIIEAETRKKNINWEKHNEAHRRIEAAQRKIEAESAVVNEQSRKIEKKIVKQSAAIEAESRRYEEESRRYEEESRRYEAEARRNEEESRRIEAESRRIEAESRRVNKQTQTFVSYPEAVCSPNPVESEDITDKVIRDLRKGGYQSDIRSFELNEKNLIINGNTQSGAMFEKVKKYTKPGMRILYNIEIR